MRQDTENLNAQLERAFYGQRLPAWGIHNQTTIVLLATLAENAWTRHLWHHQTTRAPARRHHPAPKPPNQRRSSCNGTGNPAQASEPPPTGASRSGFHDRPLIGR
jgi:hypothetical protein